MSEQGTKVEVYDFLGNLIEVGDTIVVLRETAEGECDDAGELAKVIGVRKREDGFLVIRVDGENLLGELYGPDVVVVKTPSP